jgi:fucose 4-O-acetylase-like acetyltransferase
MVRPLFSGKYPYSKLAYPLSGGLQRLIYYPAVLIFIISMMVLTPDKKLPFTEAGKRTLQIYFWHFSLIVPLKVLGVFTYITKTLPGVLRWLAFFAIALGITIFFSLPFWGYPFRYLKKILSRDSSRS